MKCDGKGQQPSAQVTRVIGAGIDMKNQSEHTRRQNIKLQLKNITGKILAIADSVNPNCVIDISCKFQGEGPNTVGENSDSIPRDAYTWFR